MFQLWAKMPRDHRGHTHVWNLRVQRTFLSTLADNEMQDEVTVPGSKREQELDEGNQQGVGRNQCESRFELICGFR